MRKIFVIGALFALAGCTDATIAQLGAYGDAADIKCYSGTALIYDGRSTGKVESVQNSDGYLFKDAATRKLTEVSGNCVITYGD